MSKPFDHALDRFLDPFLADAVSTRDPLVLLGGFNTFIVSTALMLMLVFDANSAFSEEIIGRRALPFAPHLPSTEGSRSVHTKLDADNMDVATAKSLCGPVATYQDVERYLGNLGPTVAFVNTHQKPTGQIRWNTDISVALRGTNDSPGTVEGKRWCSGSLIGKDLFLTAAHCFQIDLNGWMTPRRAGVPLKPHELATLMHVNFDYQIDGNSGNLRAEKSFPVVRLVEFGMDDQHRRLDFAIIELGVAAEGAVPGDEFGSVSIDLIGESLTSSTFLTIIQHPDGEPKKVAAGPLDKMKDPYLLYKNLDTLGGSSGAPVFASDGKQVAVHTNGGCDKIGANQGVSLKAIKERNASNIIK